MYLEVQCTIDKREVVYIVLLHNNYSTCSVIEGAGGWAWMYGEVAVATPDCLRMCVKWLMALSGEPNDPSGYDFHRVAAWCHSVTIKRNLVFAH